MKHFAGAWTPLLKLSHWLHKISDVLGINTLFHKLWINFSSCFCDKSILLATCARQKCDSMKAVIKVQRIKKSASSLHFTELQKEFQLIAYIFSPKCKSACYGWEIGFLLNIKQQIISREAKSCETKKTELKECPLSPHQWPYCSEASAIENW